MRRKYTQMILLFFDIESIDRKFDRMWGAPEIIVIDMVVIKHQGHGASSKSIFSEPPYVLHQNTFSRL